jgi:hypothetical protein
MMMAMTSGTHMMVPRFEEDKAKKPQYDKYYSGYEK